MASKNKALLMLVFTTVFWGVSFPVFKAMSLRQQILLPGASTWLISSLSLVIRFGVAALFLLLFSARSVRGLTRAEVQQGFGLGLFGGLGLLFQMDGLSYTAASTSAFLTQCYCFLIPLWVALRHRRGPTPTLLVSCALVIAGAAVLARLDPWDLKLGRGELETLVSSVLFTGQILWLERPQFVHNKVAHSTFVMFAMVALVMLPFAMLSSRAPSDVLRLYSEGFTLACVGLLTVACTVASYLLMNFWQPFVEAAEAGLIYCAEPLFTSLFALFLPAMLSRWGGVEYENEHLSTNLLLGGGLITAANVWLQLAPKLRSRKGRLQAPSSESPL